MQTEISKEKLDNVINYLEDWSEKLDNSIIREPQHISEVLPIVLQILKDKKEDIEKEASDQKFYAPAWVYGLLAHLSSSKEPISQVEYNHYKNEVSKLSVTDFKPAAPGMTGYVVKYTNPKEISELVLALKSYFRLI